MESPDDIPLVNRVGSLSSVVSSNDMSDSFKTVPDTLSVFVDEGVVSTAGSDGAPAATTGASVKYGMPPDGKTDDEEELTAARRQHLYLTQKSNDGKDLRVDSVLVYKPDDNDKEKERTREEAREKFHEILRNEGLILEEVPKEESSDGNTCFVKIHATWDVLAFYAEFINLKMPIQKAVPVTKERGCLSGLGHWIWEQMPNFFTSAVSEEEDYFTAPFRRDKLDMFVINDKDKFFTFAQRSLLVDEAMRRAVQNRSSGTEVLADDYFCLEKLISNGTYECRLILHDGPFQVNQDYETYGADNDRHELYEIWARWGNVFKYQPLDHVRKYFGERIAIYFCWLGMYTTWLVPVSFIGLCCFIYGCATVLNNVPSNEICHANLGGNLTMCPLCDKYCTYWKLNRSCLYSRLTYIFDNEATIFFAIVMSLWATLFLEFWKRKEYEVQYDWDVQNFEEEEAVRPEYEVACGDKFVHMNPVSGMQEPHIPSHYRAPRFCLSVVTVVFMVSLVIAALIGVIVYRVVMGGVFYALGDKTGDVAGSAMKKWSRQIITGTAAGIQLIIIFTLNRIYRMLAIVLTNWELTRTETDYEDSFTFKMYCFQFVNYYGSLVYIAYFKGNFVGRPGAYNYAISGKRQEECDPAGCLVELCIQMIVIFGGKQIMNNFMELGMPYLKTCFRRRRLKQKVLKSGEDPVGEEPEEDEEVNQSWRSRLPQYEKDLRLEEVNRLQLFDEYLEMVVQFGFVTLFVAAFPLAPLFALINNVLEIRLDAIKFVTLWRRQLAKKAQDIGVWSQILKALSTISVLTNALIIGYTSDAIPRMVFRFYYNGNYTLNGYTEWHMSLFATKDFQNSSRPQVTNDDFRDLANVTECYYRGFRIRPGQPNEYQYSTTFWHVLCARFIFILVFEHFVFFLTSVIDWIVSDVPPKVKLAVLQERYQVNSALLEGEARGRTNSATDDSRM